MRKTKRVTIKDIAELAGVSKATASLVLNGRSKELRVAEETRERVLAIAKEHHYQPSIHARSLRDNRSHTIGLVVPEITNYGFAVFSHELETLCREAGVQLLISCSDENPGQETVVVNNMVARQVDGLIVASSMLNDADYQKLSEQLPVVLFDRHMNDSSLPLLEIPHLLHGSLRLAQKLAGIVHGQASGVVQLDFVFASGKQRHAKIIFQMLHRAGHRRRGDMKFLCHTAERAEVGKGHKLAQLIQIDHGGSLLRFIF